MSTKAGELTEKTLHGHGWVDHVEPLPASNALVGLIHSFALADYMAGDVDWDAPFPSHSGILIFCRRPSTHILTPRRPIGPILLPTLPSSMMLIILLSAISNIFLEQNRALGLMQ